MGRAGVVTVVLGVCTSCLIRESRDPQEEARARYAAANEARDRYAAERQERAQAKAADRQKEREASSARYADRERLLDDFNKLGSSCRELDEFEASLETRLERQEPDAKGMLRAQFEKMLAKRRSEQADRRLSKAEHIMRQSHDMSDIENPELVLEDIPEVRRLLVEAECYKPDVTRLADVRGRIDTWTVALERSVAEEKRCRANPMCLGDRIAEPLCEAIADRRWCNEQMAKERRNPSGYVDKTILYKLGAQIQEDDEKIAELKKEYAAVARVPFSESRCPKKP